MKRKAMQRKWKDNRGETLVEVMASILVGTLSVALLFSAVMASAKMDRTAKEADAKFRESLNKAEKQETDATADIITSGANAQVTVKNGSGSVPEQKLTVKFYGDEQLLSYR